MQYRPYSCTHLSTRSVLSSFILSAHFNLSSFLSAENNHSFFKNLLSCLPSQPFIHLPPLPPTLSLWTWFITSPLLFSSPSSSFLFILFTLSPPIHVLFIVWPLQTSPHLCLTICPLLIPVSHPSSCFPPVVLLNLLPSCTRTSSNYSVRSLYCSSKLCFTPFLCAPLSHVKLPSLVVSFLCLFHLNHPHILSLVSRLIYFSLFCLISSNTTQSPNGGHFPKSPQPCL